MASNLMYSPVPVYPAAAAASHVQGEVKLSADVDRNGNVASVRVISGPPLLRDAAIDAVQRWRYRPYLSSRGPIPVAAIAVMDFQLP
jgi:TonB family protein